MIGLLLLAILTTKPAWQWSVDERLAARFDASARKQRVDEYMSGRATSEPRPTDVIEGSKHPELLMPFEIFSSFTRAAFGAEDETARAIRDEALQKGVALGLPRDFLVAWRRDAEPFINAAANDQLGVMECRARAEAMRKLRSDFGERFDRFLYDVAARNVVRDYLGPVSQQQLRNEEEGCR